MKPSILEVHKIGLLLFILCREVIVPQSFKFNYQSNLHETNFIGFAILKNRFISCN
jgi:hypothetical protein